MRKTAAGDPILAYNPRFSYGFCGILYTIYIYITSSLNFGFEIAIPGREREQGRFRGSIEGAGKEHEGVKESTEEHYGVAAGGRLK